MRAIVLVNAYIRSPGMIRQAERVAEELRLRGAETSVMKNGEFSAYVHENRITLRQNCDFVVNLDKDKYLPRMLEKCGVRVFNSARAVELCDDKMLTCIELAGAGLNLPDTVPAPLCYYADAHAEEEFLRGIERPLQVLSDRCAATYHKLSDRETAVFITSFEERGSAAFALQEGSRIRESKFCKIEKGMIVFESAAAYIAVEHK